MTFFDKYSRNGTFDNYCLEQMLIDLDISHSLVNEIIIRNSISSLTKEFIEELKQKDSKENIINTILEFFLLADKTKPITCNKDTLASITGLSHRQIDEQRRARLIPFIQISGQSGSGRKIIVYDPKEVIKYMEKHKVKVTA